MSIELHGKVAAFVDEVVTAMGLPLRAAVDQTDDGVRINLEGEQGDRLLRRKGEALEALQYIINAVFRDELDSGQRIVVDCMGFRRARDGELRQMAKFLIDKAKSSGTPQELGPLNSYARRLVHMEVAEDGGVTSESLGEGSMKRVVISPK